MKCEMVLCVTAGVVPLSQGVVPIDESEFDRIFAPQHLWMVSRAKCEGDPSFRQIIPYVVLSDPTDHTVVTYTRGQSGGEDRLHDKVSIGFGGHISVADLVLVAGTELIDVRQTVRRATLRELDEEITCNGGAIIGNSMSLINDLSDAVGQVHLGLLLQGEAAAVRSKEDSQLNVTNVTWEALPDLSKRLEGWSVMAAQHLTW